MGTLLEKGLAATAAQWPAISRAYAWVHRAASILANEAAQSSLYVRHELRTVLYEMRQAQAELGPLAAAVSHFRTVSVSHWRYLFRCYELPDVPRTNNALEQFFGSARYHERRASGRKVASPSLVVRGAVRIVAAVACQAQQFAAADLRPQSIREWRELRASLARRQESRRRQLRFRRDPDAYLGALEDALLKPSLPS